MKNLVSTLEYKLPGIVVKYYFYYEEDRDVHQKVQGVVMCFCTRDDESKKKFGGIVIDNLTFRGPLHIERARDWLLEKVHDFRKKHLNSTGVSPSIGPVSKEQGPSRR